MDITKWKTPAWKGCKLLDSNHTPFWERQRYGNKELTGFQRLEGREGWVGRAQWIFRPVEILWITPYWWIHVVTHLSNPWNEQGFPSGSDSKESACQCRRPQYNPWFGKIHWRRKRQPIPVFLPGEYHGQKSQEGYSPRGRQESDTTESLTLSLSTLFHA